MSPVPAGWLFFLSCLCAFAPLREARADPVHRLSLTVIEPAGIRRFGYPVSAVLRLDRPLGPSEHCCLLSGGKLVPAQFVSEPDSRSPILNLDFDTSLAPFERRGYVVEYGDVEPGPQTRGGLEIEVHKDAFGVRYPGELEFLVPRNLIGLLSRVHAGKLEYLRPNSAGLLLRYKDDIHFRAGGKGPYGMATTARIRKQGPLAATLEFTGTEALRGDRSVRSKVTLDFPRSKSWVRVTWQIEDPAGLVAALGADLDLLLDGEPALVDFGAGSLVYAHLRKDEAARLRAGSLTSASGSNSPAWQTWAGPADRLAAYVTAPPGSATRAEGWAHVMDRQRCTAVALAGFADPGQQSEITVHADGRLQIWRSFAQETKPSTSRRELVFWLHFVDMPVQVGAVTSPQSMLAPLRVELPPAAGE
jgi:hypothetical protein